MKITTVEPKAYIKLRIIATLLDLLIFLSACLIYIYIFDQTPDDGKLSVNGILTLPLFIAWIFYFPGTEAMSGATPGHDICKLVVVNKNGSKVSFGTALKRRICDLFDFNVYGIPAIICIAKTEKHQRIGDLWADTLVVKKSDIIVEEVIF